MGFCLKVLAQIGKRASRAGNLVRPFASFRLRCDMAKTLVGRAIKMVEGRANRSFATHHVVMLIEAHGIENERDNAVDSLRHQR